MIVVEAKIEDKGETYRILLRLCFVLSAIARRYFVDAHIKDLPLNELKKAYIQRYGISGRHFNSIRYEIDGKVKAWEEGKALRQSKRQDRSRRLRKPSRG